MLSEAEQLWPQWCNALSAVLYNVHVDINGGGGVSFWKGCAKEPPEHQCLLLLIVSELSVSFPNRKTPFELTHSLTLEKTWCAIVIVFVRFLFFVFHCTGQIWRSDAELLGAVWRPRWLRGCCHGFTPLASSHRPAPSGGDGDPLHSQPAGSHVSGRGAHQSSPHPDFSACTHQGSIAAGCSGGTLLAWKPTHALLYWEEDFTGEPGDRSNWECFQRHGKRCSEANKPEIWNRTKPYYERNSLYWT